MARNKRRNTTYVQNLSASQQDGMPLDDAITKQVAADLDAAELTLNNHHARHEYGQPDEVEIDQHQVTNLVGDLLNLTNLIVAIDNAAEHTANKNVNGGYAGLGGTGKVLGTAQVYGTAANTAAEGNDARLSDARTPTAHHTSHENGGADEISVNGLSGVLSDPQPPATHGVEHAEAGADEVQVTWLAGYDGDTTHFLRGDKTWAVPAGGGGGGLTLPQALAVASFRG